MTRLIYVAHKFGGNLRNALDAEHFTALLNLRIDGAVFICPWLPMVRHWVDSGAARERGLMLDIEAVKRRDGLIALSPLEGGVAQEWDAAKARLHFEREMYEIDNFYRGDMLISRVDYHWSTLQSWINQLVES